jgi:ACS family hexuronate transporter-like MFS transporter
MNHAVSRIRSRVRAIPYPWIVVGLSVIGSMGVAWPFRGIPMLYPFIQEDLGLSRSQIGLITAALLVGGIPMHTIGGWLIDVVGVRRVMTITLAGQALATASFLFGVSLPIILASAVLVGSLEAPGFLGGARAIVDWVPKNTRGLATGLWTNGGALGGVTAAVLLPTIAESFGWRAAAVILGGLILLIASVYGFLYRDARENQNAHPPFNWATFRLLASHRGLVVTTIWGSLFRGIHFTILTYLILFMTEELELSMVAAGGYMATAYVVSLGARIVWGAISDFLFEARRLPVCGIVGMLAAAGLAGTGMMGNWLPDRALIIIIVLLGASTLSWAGLYTNLVGEMVSPEKFGTALGTSGTVTTVIALIMPPTFGLFVDWTDFYQLAWGLVAAIAFIGTLALLVLVPHEGFKASASDQERMPTS